MQGLQLLGRQLFQESDVASINLWSKIHENVFAPVCHFWTALWLGPALCILTVNVFGTDCTVQSYSQNHFFVVLPLLIAVQYSTFSSYVSLVLGSKPK
jgi:hypothetical protein